MLLRIPLSIRAGASVSDRSRSLVSEACRTCAAGKGPPSMRLVQRCPKARAAFPLRNAPPEPGWFGPVQGPREALAAFLRGNGWCCQTGLNCRPLHYQWSALPLSYGSMPGIRRIGPKRPLQAAGSCHKGPSGASTRRAPIGPKTGKNLHGWWLAASKRAGSGPIGSIS